VKFDFTETIEMIEWSQFVNWIVSGLIGFIFGAFGAYFSYRLDRKRDEQNFEKDRIRFELEQKKEIDKLEQVWRQKLAELKIEIENEQQKRKFAKLHEKRFEVTGIIYQQLVEFKQLLKNPLANDSAFLEEYRMIAQRIEEGERYFEKNRIYLPQDACIALDQIYHEFNDMSMKLFELGVNLENQIKFQNYQNLKSVKYYGDKLYHLSQSIYAIIRELEREFRGILDVKVGK
jgi:hypothetical protein